MKNIKRSTLGLMLGLTIALAGISYAQSKTQTDANKQPECCSMAMGCCSGDSCQMIKKDAAKNHATSGDKNGCCCCSGDSCQMIKKDAARNHATSGNKAGCCGDSCQMKADGAKNHATAGGKDGCCGDSCQMKHDATATATLANDTPAKHECCCCGDSCDMNHMKTAKEKP